MAKHLVGEYDVLLGDTTISNQVLSQKNLNATTDGVSS